MSKEVIDVGHVSAIAASPTGASLRQRRLPRAFEATVVAVDEERSSFALAKTAFFPTGGGQPHHLGVVRFGDSTAQVTDVRKGNDGVVWHVAATASLPAVGNSVRAEIDWDRR